MGKIPTSIVNVVIDQSIYKFRASAKFLSAGNARIVFADSIDWTFAGGDFTIGGWKRFVTLPANGIFQIFASQAVDANNRWLYSIYNNAGTYQIWFYGVDGGVAKIYQTSNLGAIAVGDWHYFESCRNGVSFYHSMDGNQLAINGGGIPPGANVLNNLAASLYISYQNLGGSNFPLNAYSDDFFIDKGIALHIVDFALPVAPKTIDGFTVLYLPYDVDFSFADVDHDETAAADMPSRDFAHNALGDPTFSLQEITAPARKLSFLRNKEDWVESFLIFTNGVGFADWTPQANDAVVNDFPLFPVVWHALHRTYIGYRRKFDTVLIDVSVNKVGAGSFVWEYWNGAAWVSLIDFYDSSTSFEFGNLARINHTPQADWQQTAVNGTTLFWLRYYQNGAMAVIPRGTQAWLGHYALPTKIVTPIEYAPKIGGLGPILPPLQKGVSDLLTIADIDKVSYIYDNFTGIAPDALSAYVPFGYKSLYLSIIAFGDIVIDFTEAGTNPYIVYNDPRKKIYKLEVEGFRIRNLIPGSNVEYQILAYR